MRESNEKGQVYGKQIGKGATEIPPFLVGFSVWVLFSERCLYCKK